MADVGTEKTIPTAETTAAGHHDLEGAGGAARPAGWMYKSFGVGPFRAWYASPAVQLVLGTPFYPLWLLMVANEF